MRTLLFFHRIDQRNQNREIPRRKLRVDMVAEQIESVAMEAANRCARHSWNTSNLEADLFGAQDGAENRSELGSDQRLFGKELRRFTENVEEMLIATLDPSNTVGKCERSLQNRTEGQPKRW